ncbi:MAG: hypothetical protein PVJ02_06920 [Gemmatimonadota bacterium]
MELITVVMVMGTLVRMSVPNLHDLLLKARATEVAGYFQTVRLAAMSYHADHHRWPDDGYAGLVPTDLAPYLPQGFSFQQQGYRLDWESWALPDGLPGDAPIRGLVGISVVTGDRELGQAVQDLLGHAMAHYTLDDTYTFVVERE